MRVVSWNMNHALRAEAARESCWRFLRDTLKADLALVQEALPPVGLGAVGRAIDPKNPRYDWGAFVVSLNPRFAVRPRVRRGLGSPLEAGELLDSHPGSSAVADVIDTGTSAVCFAAVSFYAQWEYFPTGVPVEGQKQRYEIYSAATAHRILSDLTPLLVWTKSTPHVTPVLLAGDFNASTQVAAANQWELEREEARILFERLRALGLVDLVDHTKDTRPRLEGCSCDAPASCSHVRTYRSQNRSDSRPTQLDYAFVSSALLSRVSSCAVRDEAAAWELSDHCPLVIDLREAWSP